MRKQFVCTLAVILIALSNAYYFAKTVVPEISVNLSFLSIPKKLRPSALYGTDYTGYQELNRLSSPTATILAVGPDAQIYNFKMNYFLYPRHITFTAEPLSITPEMLPDFDYIYIYYPVFDSLGYIRDGINALEKPGWSESEIFQLTQSLDINLAKSTPAEFHQAITKVQGNLMFAN